MENNNSHTRWPLWPLMLLAFIYPINNSLMSVVIPLYFFNAGVEIEIIGLLVAGAAMTYSFSPLLLDKISERIGRKNSVIISMVGMGAAQTVFFITLDPFLFFISRLTEGFFMGMFWTKLQSCMSELPSEVHSFYTSRYNLSWNGGIIAGSIIGLVGIFLLNDLLFIFYLCPFLIFFSLIIAIAFFHEPDHQGYVPMEYKSELAEKRNNQRNFQKYYIPVILPVLCAIGFGLVKSTVNFLYPIESEILGFPTYTVYLMVLFTIIAQLTSTAIASLFSMKVLKIMTITSIISLAVIVFIYGINTNFIVFSILFFSMGFFAGILYGIALKLFISLNARKKTSKYSAVIESVIGTMFLLGPVIAGFIAVLSLEIAYYSISLSLTILILFVLIYVRKIGLEE